MLILLISLFSFNTMASNCRYKEVSRVIGEYKTFKHNQKINKFFTKTIIKYGKKHKVDCILMATILKVESDFVHKQNNLTPNDFGIAQINYPIQKKNLKRYGVKINKNKLIKSNKYSIEIMAIILKYLKKSHPKDSLWFARYNSGYYLHKLAYLHLLEVQWKKVGYNDYFVDYKEKKRIYEYCVKKYGWKRLAEIYTPLYNKKERYAKYKKRIKKNK